MESQRCATESKLAASVRKAPLADIRDASKANGMRELKEDGFDKILAGITTPEEVMRVVFTAGH